MEEKFKSRNFCLLLYPSEDSTHAAALEYIRSQFRFASISHDKDVWSSEDEATNPEHKAGTLKKVHTHVVVQFSQARWSSALAKELGITENYIQRCRSLESALRYLVHADADNKTQYDLSCVEGPLKCVLEKSMIDVTEDERVIKLLDMLDSFDGVVSFISFNCFVKLACSKGLYADLRRSGALFIRLIQEHNSMFEE